MEETTQKTSGAGKDAGVSIRVVGAVTIGIAMLFAFYAFALAGRIAEAEAGVAEDEKTFVACSEAVDDLQMGSDFLTAQARTFVLTGRREYMDAYLREINVTNRRGKAVDVLKANFGSDQEAATVLNQALLASDALAERELAAMRLASEHYGLEDVPDEVAHANTDVTREQSGKGKKLEVATSLMLDDGYVEAKQGIDDKVAASSTALLEQLDAELEQNEVHMQGLLFQLRIAVALLLCVVMVFVLALFLYVLKPLGRYVERIRANEPLETDGAYELYYLANAYNTVYEDNSKRIEHLREYAERDPLTGISNRSGYDSFLATHTRNIALLLIDIDDFNEFNAVYGHDMGDAVLIKLAEALGTAFRSTDFPCRLEGDRFAVVMTNMSNELRFAILNKIELVNSILSDEAMDLPLVTLSVGAAFSTEDMSDRDIYDAASAALAQAKRTKAGSIVFYGEGNEAVEL